MTTETIYTKMAVYGYKPTRTNKVFWEAAAMAFDSGASVDADSSFSTVSIDWDDGGEAFLQGEEADELIQEIEDLWKKYPKLPRSVAERAIVWPIIESYSN